MYGYEFAKFHHRTRNESFVITNFRDKIEIEISLWLFKKKEREKKNLFFSQTCKFCNEKSAIKQIYFYSSKRFHLTGMNENTEAHADR